MRAELRPSTFGEILDRTVQLYRGRFGLFFGIAAVGQAAALAIQLLGLLITRAVTGSPGSHQGVRSALSGLAAGIESLLVLIPLTLTGAALITAVSAIYLGERATIREAYARLRSHWLRYIGVVAAVLFYSWGPVFAVMVIFLMILGALLKGAHPSLGSSATGALVGGLLLLLAGIAGACWIALRWALALPASLFEDLRVHASLRRSSFLTRDHRGRLFVLLLLVIAVSTILQYATHLPLLLMVFRHKASGISIAWRAEGELVSFFVGSLVAPIYGIALTLFYYDERIRKEGFDLEWLMERGGESGQETNYGSGSLPSGPLPSGPMPSDFSGSPGPLPG
jgi:hypothetical protein